MLVQTTSVTTTGSGQQLYIDIGAEAVKLHVRFYVYSAYPILVGGSIFVNGRDIEDIGNVGFDGAGAYVDVTYCRQADGSWNRYINCDSETRVALNTRIDRIGVDVGNLSVVSSLEVETWAVMQSCLRCDGTGMCVSVPNCLPVSSDCTIEGQACQHLDCQLGRCVPVPGAGPNVAGCQVAYEACGGPPPPCTGADCPPPPPPPPPIPDVLALVGPLVVVGATALGGVLLLKALVRIRDGGT